MDYIFWIPVVLTSLFLASGFVFLFRIPVSRESKIGEYPKISIIIPARNEEHNIGKLLKSIFDQEFSADEVIVVNDESTDRTKEISLEFGARVIDSQALPEGWLGKPWACYQGAKAAEGEILIFLDSDIEIERGGLKRIADTFISKNENEKVVMSIAPYHKVKEFYEDFSAMFNIIMVGAMNAFTPFKSEPTGLFGPSLIISKEDYFSIGGHEAVKGKVLENVFMAELLQEKGCRLLCLGGRDSLSFRMYPDGFGKLINGWTKAFASGASRVSPFAMTMIIFWISAGFLSAIFFARSLVIGEDIILWSGFYLAYALQLIWMLKRLGRFKFISGLLFPLHLIFYVVVFSRSAYFQKTGKKVEWKARKVRG
jgi:4,4'-diaponeurosporenoate glycosyltransferase